MVIIILAVVLGVALVAELAFFVSSLKCAGRLRSSMEFGGVKYPDASWQISLEGRSVIGVEPISSINEYLKKVRSAGDFGVVRDIVDRYVERREGEARADIQMPLFAGLFGALAGVVLGVLALWQDATDFTPMLRDVGYGVGCCLVGLVLTIVASRQFGAAKFDNEKNKNALLTLLQTHLRPSEASIGPQPAAPAHMPSQTGVAGGQSERVVEGLRASLDAIRGIAENQAALKEAIKALPIVALKAEGGNMNLAIGQADSDVSHAIIDLQASIGASMDKLKEESLRRCEAIAKIVEEESAVVGARAKELTSLTESVSAAARQMSDLHKRMDDATQAMEKAAAAVESLSQVISASSTSSKRGLFKRLFKR